MDETEHEKRLAIIEHCREMNRNGLNQGMSGNISVRHDEGLLITPTSIAYDNLVPEDIVFLNTDGTSSGRHGPSSEWRFHLAIMENRSDISAIVHAHPTFCVALAIMGMDIPAVHYMVAVAGGSSIRCAPYAIYGSSELSHHVLEALQHRTACLLAHHGMIAIGADLEQAMWRAVEVETLAHQFHAALQIGDPPVLSEQQVQDVINKMHGYGLQD